MMVIAENRVHRYGGDRICVACQAIFGPDVSVDLLTRQAALLCCTVVRAKDDLQTFLLVIRPRRSGFRLHSSRTRKTWSSISLSIDPDIFYLLWSLHSQNRLKSHKRSYQDAIVVLIRYLATLAEVAYLASSDEKLHAMHTRSLSRRQRASSTWKLGSKSPRRDSGRSFLSVAAPLS